MSEQIIDERVVSMKFDNEEFEKNATQSLSTIQKLKQALNFKDSVKGLDAVEKAMYNNEFSQEVLAEFTSCDISTTVEKLTISKVKKEDKENE